MDRSRDVLEAVRDMGVDLLDGAELPRWVLVRRRSEPAAEVDFDAVVGSGIRDLADGLGGLAGRRIAVGVGSRGIRDVAAVVAATVGALREQGAEPFVVPAMGSHGSSHASGQAAVLADLGVTEEALGVPVTATMDTVLLGRTGSGVPVHLDAAVAAADGVIVVNRVKPHTDFAGDFGSGLAKMAAIGLGNITGATVVHADGSAELPRVITEFVEVLRDAGVLLGGVAIVEDSLGRTAEVAVVDAEGVAGDHERRLVARARSLHGHLPFEDLDVLVVDTMGKDISGAGMDTNVLGRFWIPGVPEPSGPHIAAVTVHRLTAASRGNASGIGLADLVPAALIADVDLPATYVNALTSGTGGLRRSRLPMVLPTDRDVVHAAARMCGRRTIRDVRLVRVVSTLHLGEMLVSEPLLDAVAADPSLEVADEPRPVVFGARGELPAWPHL
ncbi:MAG: lactate racemase domain-containing protein [Ornithinimicrobium sp.]|uniref:lactate racemase domain-containing protein n=1 Tax=Ornithinimicrobium sp. TaxID=1977084 RepID=UPI003D9BEBE8